MPQVQLTQSRVVQAAHNKKQMEKIQSLFTLLIRQITTGLYNLANTTLKPR